MPTTMIVFRSGTAYPQLHRLAERVRLPIFTRLVAAVARDSTARRRPRTHEEMERALDETLSASVPPRVVVVDDQRAGLIDWSAADEIVLAWPDANGAGWQEVERLIFARKRSGTPIHVVNGRGRRFVLDHGLWRTFKARRFLEKTLALEISFLLVFVAATPWLWFWHLARGESRTP